MFLKETPEPSDWKRLRAAESCSRDAARGPPAQPPGTCCRLRCRLLPEDSGSGPAPLLSDYLCPLLCAVSRVTVHLQPRDSDPPFLLGPATQQRKNWGAGRAAGHRGPCAPSSSAPWAHPHTPPHKAMLRPNPLHFLPAESPPRAGKKALGKTPSCEEEEEEPARGPQALPLRTVRAGPSVPFPASVCPKERAQRRQSKARRAQQWGPSCPPAASRPKAAAHAFHPLLEHTELRPC